jgi:hypothetical protein
MSILGLNRDLPFSDIRAIDVIFSDDVAVNSADLALASTITAGKAYAMSGFAYNSTTHDATWSLPNALDIDKVSLNLSGIQTAGGISVGAYSSNFAILPGDFNGDDSVDSLDLVGIRNGMVGTLDKALEIWADINGDGTIDVNDYNIVKKNVGKHF